MEDKEYQILGLIIGFIAFVLIYLYALVEWGFLIGLVFGWLPALIGGLLIGFLWPVALIIIFVMYVLSL
jgi:hypothetical protein